jgi:predicted phage terminase large subunit-like protein
MITSAYSQLSVRQRRARRRIKRTEVHTDPASRHLLDFTVRTYPQYVAEPMHMLIADPLEAVLRGEVERLMIFAPPQTGKSQLVSVHFPAFWLGQRPDDPVILTGYGASLAHAKSWEARNLVESPAFGALFPGVRTDESSRARDFWRIAGRRGGVVAAGVGGPITGHGAKLGLIDDPFENWEQAQSPVIREKVWQWWRSTFRTRIWEGGAVVLITTRWHEDDLAGRLLQDQGDRWTVLRLPALAETQAERDENNARLGLPTGQPDPLGRAPGEPVCPLRFSLAALRAIQADVGAQAWHAQYQGVPRPPEGQRFRRGWFEIVGEVPAGARRVRYWDKAGTPGAGAYSAGLLMAVVGARPDWTFYVEDVARGRWSSGEREKVIHQTAELDAERFGHVETVVEQEPGSGGKESAENTVANLAGFPVYADRVTGDKDVRLEPFAAQAEAGNVKLVRGPWNWEYLEEICAVPSGRFRDQADTSAGAFNRLARAYGGGRLGHVTLRARR